MRCRWSPNEVEFIVAQAGGHPGLLRSATRLGGCAFCPVCRPARDLKL